MAAASPNPIPNSSSGVSAAPKTRGRLEGVALRNAVAELRQQLVVANEEIVSLRKENDQLKISRRVGRPTKTDLQLIEERRKHANTVRKLKRELDKRDQMLTALRGELDSRTAADWYIRKAWEKLHPGVALPRARKDVTLGVAEAWLALQEAQLVSD